MEKVAGAYLRKERRNIDVDLTVRSFHRDSRAVPLLRALLSVFSLPLSDVDIIGSDVLPCLGIHVSSATSVSS